LVTSIRKRCGAALGFLLAIAVWSAAGLADEPTEVTTTLAVEPQVGSGQAVTVSANEKKQPVNQMLLSVYLGAIPADARLISCAFRLVTASGVPKEQYNGVHLQLFDAAQDAKTAKSIAAPPTVDAGTVVGTIVEVKSDGLCQTLKQKIAALAAAATAPESVPGGLYLAPNPALALDPRLANQPWCRDPRIEKGFLTAECQGVNSTLGPIDRCAPGSIMPAQDGKLGCVPVPIGSVSTAEFRLQTTNPNAEVSFWGRESVEPDKAPRLLLTYVLPNSWPGRADWSQPRRDAQQSGRSPWRIYNDKGAYTPASFAVRPLGNATFTDVSPPLLLYSRQLVAVSGGSNVQIMDADGAVLRTIPLTAAPKFIGISQQGWLYATSTNKIVMQPLQGGLQFMIDIGGEETVLDPPTIGDDGSLYVVTSKFVYAYPPPPVPTTLANVPLWRHLTQTGNEKNNDVSAVALSEDGRTAYFVDKQNKAIFALDAATGKEKWKAEGVETSRGEKDPMPVPVVASGAIFVTDHAPTASRLYIFDGGSGALLGTISGNRNIAAPVVGPDQSVYYFRDGLVQWRRSNRENGNGKQTAGTDGCEKFEADLLRADLSGNIYALNRKQDALAVLPAAGGKCIQLTDTPPPGSYTGSCREQTMNGTILTANCQRANGAWQPTALNVAQCVGDIGNHNGNLGCQGGRPASPSPAPPKLDIASLVIAPDGSMFGYSREQKLVRITAVAPGRLELSNEILGLSKDGKALVKNNDMTFRAGEVVTEPNLTLPANTNINIVAEKGIAFRPGLHIAAGARLHAGMGN
jgi:outer membrane protein assembly factor BamB